MGKLGEHLGERVITCPICFDDDMCFEDRFENFSSYLCTKCGYCSNSFYTADSKQLAEHKKGTAKVVNELEIFDHDREIFWYPSVINMGKLGIIFPEGVMNNWKWKYAKVVPVAEGDEEKYPVEGKEVEFHTSFLDVDNAVSYEPYDFLQALRDMGIAKDM